MKITLVHKDILSGLSGLFVVSVLVVGGFSISSLSPFVHVAYAQEDDGGDYSGGCCGDVGSYTPDTSYSYSPDTSYSYSPDTSYDYSPDSSYSYSPDTYSSGYSYSPSYLAGSGYTTGGYLTGSSYLTSPGYSAPGYITAPVAPSNSNTNVNTNTNTSNNGNTSFCTTPNTCDTTTTITDNGNTSTYAPVTIDSGNTSTVNDTYSPPEIVSQPTQTQTQTQTVYVASASTPAPVYTNPYSYIPTPTCNTCGCYGYETCQPPVLYNPPIAYNNPSPYVTLSQVPYTGLDLSLWQLILYWSFLVLWCLAAAYLIVIKRVQNRILNSIKKFLLGTSKTAIAKSTPEATVQSQNIDINALAVQIAALINPKVSAVKNAPLTDESDMIDSFVLSQINRAHA